MYAEGSKLQRQALRNTDISKKWKEEIMNT
jgi:hypothetical protein